MSKLGDAFHIERAPNGGFVVKTAPGPGRYPQDLLAAFSSPVDLIGWLSRNLMPDVAAARAPEQPVASPPIGRLESAYVSPPMRQVEREIAILQEGKPQLSQQQLNDKMMAELDKVRPIRPAAPENMHPALHGPMLNPPGSNWPEGGGAT